MFTSTLFGFAGEIGAGKSEAAKRLHGVAGVPYSHIEFSDQIIPIATGLMARVGLAGTISLEHLAAEMSEVHDICLTEAQLAGFSIGALTGYLEARSSFAPEEHLITPHTKELHRPLLQWLGSAFVDHVDHGFWSKMVAKQIQTVIVQGAELVTVGGVRYPDNAQMIRAHNGHVVEVLKPEAERHALQSHVAEAGIDPELVDVTVLNNGTIIDLQAKIARLWQDTQEGELRKIY